MPLGLLQAKLANRTAFFVDAFSDQALFTVTADGSTNHWDTVPDAFGEIFTPSGAVLVGFSASMYPLSNGAIYGALTIDLAPSPNKMGYVYINAAGWSLPFSWMSIVTGLDRTKLHSFIARAAMTGPGQSCYVYAGYGGQWPMEFWAMDLTGVRSI